MSRWEFFKVCWASAFDGAWGWLGAISTALGVLVPLLATVATRKPEAERGMLSKFLAHPRIPDLVWFIPLALALIIFVVRFFITAPYDIFKVEEQRRLAMERPSGLTGEIEFYALGYSPELHGSQMFIQVSVRNSGPPTIVEGWRLKIHKDKSILFFDRPTLIPDNYALLKEDGTKYVFPPGNDLTASAVTPIPTGAVVRGWLRFVMPGIATEGIRQPGTLLTLYFHDINRNTTEASMTVRETVPGSGQLIQPGTVNPFLQQPKP